MIKIRKKTVATLALSALAVTTTLALPVTISAESTYEPVAIGSSEQISNNTVARDFVYLNSPTVEHTVYNAAVLYTWEGDKNGDAMAMYSSYHENMPPEIYKTTTYKDVASARIGSKDCLATYPMAASYDTQSKSSSGKTEMCCDQQIGENEYRVRYGYDSKVAITNILDCDQSAKVPTDYDKPDFIWSHNAKNYFYIKGTISYQGYVSNISVKVPPLGYASSSVKLNGVTFYLRTGPWKCSIKASKAVNASDVTFAFGVAGYDL